MLSLILIVFAIVIVVVALTYLILTKCGKKKYFNTASFLIFCILVFGAVFTSSIIVISTSNKTVGESEFVAVIDEIPMYYDKSTDEYFVVSSDTFDLTKISYRVMVDKEDAAKIISSYESHKDAVNVLEKYK